MGRAGDRWCLGCRDKHRVDGRRLCFDVETAKKGFWEELLTLGNPSAPALSFMFVFMYLFSKLGGGFGSHLLFMSPGCT